MSDTDEAIEEIRRARCEISARYKDVYAYVRHLMRVDARRAKKAQRHAGKRSAGTVNAAPTSGADR